MDKIFSFYLRIQAGKFKGKKLFLPSLQSTRATKSVLKSSYFNTIQFEIEGKIFIEAFGGSGSIGLEALSRGAKKAYFIEQNKEAFALLEKNCKSISKDDTICIHGDTFVELSRVLRTIKEPVYLYIDPPFDFRSGMSDIYKKTFDMIKEFNHISVKLIAIEHFSKLKIPNEIDNFIHIKTRKFGNSSLSFFGVKG